ncbi:acyl-CoA Delta-9 desaturase-like [Lycorma delicatula]|uniref:acyl-CoA Delta-9 desaturase-like n=1 Tax=Lycorma delicatula TaxID=130591 RepID=UPI003F5105C0
MTVDSSPATGVLYEDDVLEPIVIKEPEKEYKFKVSWRNVIIHSYLHIGGLYGLYLGLTQASWQTWAFLGLMHILKNWGVAAGAHRLWTHRSYKATFPLRILLTFFFILAFEGPLIDWVRYHRVHHKYQETNADPHDARRGFWFAHYGWLLQKRHPEVLAKGKSIDITDIKEDKIIMWQKKYYWPLVISFCLAMPTFVPWYFWGESLKVAWHFAVCFQYMVSMHVTFCINSFGHIWGKRPYEKDIYARENMGVSFFTLGEGWHNYHHVFPWDYKASEFGNYELNWTAAFITFMGKIGLAYDLKSVPLDLVKKRAVRTGDGTYKEPEIWGWDDKDMPEEDKKEAIIINRRKAE